MFTLKGKRVWIAGHKGMVGSALMRRLAHENCVLITAERAALDLCAQAAVNAFMHATKPDVVILAAAKVGGIWANSQAPADFLAQNLFIQTNVLTSAQAHGVQKLLFLGSSCIYPKHASQPIHEDALLTGPLEPTNQAYAIAKIAGITLVQALRAQHGCDFISAMPCNLYGPGDNFDTQTSHVLPALIRKAHNAKMHSADHLVVWGSGKPLREFLHVDDCADALVHVLKTYSSPDPINIGSGHEVGIADLAHLVCASVRFAGRIVFDASKPDGTPRKLMDSSKLASLGWTPSINLEEGIAATYRWFLAQQNRPASAA